MWTKGKGGVESLVKRIKYDYRRSNDLEPEYSISRKHEVESALAYLKQIEEDEIARYPKNKQREARGLYIYVRKTERELRYELEAKLRQWQ